MSARLKCESCGGAVEYDTREQAAACLFCGLEALRVDDEAQSFDPDGYLPMRLDQGHADAAYRSWARASWWRPKALRDLKVQTHAIYLPAWRFVCDDDAHWAGLRRAPTASGKAPVTGRDRMRIEHVVPASGGLESEELWGLWPFEVGEMRPFDGSASPHELPAKSRRRAGVEVHAQVRQRHVQRIIDSQGLVSAKLMSQVEDLEAQTLLLPVYVGVFRFRDKPWRFLVNGQSGEVYGKAPVDRLKVAMVVGAVLLLGALIALFAGR